MDLRPPPVHRLPTELLVEILDVIYTAVFLTNKSRWHEDEMLQPRFSWIAMMRVCRRWRTVIRCTPKFWRIINVWCLNDMDRLSQYLQLCAPLRSQAQVFIHDHHVLSVDLSVIREHAPSIRLLSIEVGAEWTPSLRALLTDEPIPIQDLCMKVDRWKHRDLQVRDIGLSSRSLPCLRALELTRVDPPEDLSLYAHLRRLTICNERLLTSSWLLRILGVCSNLEYLEIDRLSREDLILDSTNGRMSFPKLRSVKLHVKGPPTILASVFTHLHLPNVTYMELSCDESLLRDEPGTQAYLPRLFKSDDDRTAVMPLLAALTSVALLMRDDTYIISGDGKAGCERVYCEVDGGDWVYSLGLGLSDLVTTFLSDKPAITHFEIDAVYFRDYANEDDFNRVFSRIPGLESLTLLGVAYAEDMACVWTALEPIHDEGEDTDEGDVQVPCPRLKSIKVGDLERDDIFSSSKAFFGKLLYTLQLRAKHGARLKTLELNLEHHTHLVYQNRRRLYMEELKAVVDGDVAYNCMIGQDISVGTVSTRVDSAY